MGNVTSFCCSDTVSQVDDCEERSRILNNDYCDDLVYNNSSAHGGGNSQQTDTISYGSFSGNGNFNKTMEQSALDKIYQKMASNVIDVAPGDSMVIQQAEFIERQKAYQIKLNQIRTPIPLKLTNRMQKQTGNNNNQQHYDQHFAINNTTSPTSSNMVTNPHHHNGHLLLATDGHNNSSLMTNSPQHLAKAQEKRRVEYEPISQDDIQLINEISSKSLIAIKNLKILTSEQVVTQFKP